MSRRWPGWEDLDGIDVEGGCNAARKQDREYVWMQIVAGPRGASGWLDMFPVAFYADGHVAVRGTTDDYLECVVEDGMLTGILAKWPEAEPEKLRMVRPCYIAIPDGDPVMYLHAYTAGPPIQGGEFNDEIESSITIDAAIDASPEESGQVSAFITIVIIRAEDDVSTAAWPLTPESAHSVLALMQKKHGAPVTEAMLSTGTFEAMTDLIEDRQDIVFVHNHEHDPE